MTWPFENDTSNIEKKLAKRSLHHERQRNLFAIIALALTAFMITATFSIGFSYFETYQMQQIRLMGTTADVGITNVTENQLVEISKSNLVLDVGIQQRLMKVLTVFQYSSGSTTDASIWRASGIMSFSRSMLEHAS